MGLDIQKVATRPVPHETIQWDGTREQAHLIIEWVLAKLREFNPDRYASISQRNHPPFVYRETFGMTSTFPRPRLDLEVIDGYATSMHKGDWVIFNSVENKIFLLGNDNYQEDFVTA